MGLLSKLDEILGQLRLNEPSALDPDDPVTDKNWNAAVASIKLLTAALKTTQNLPPERPSVGSSYIRCPGMKTPWEQYPTTLRADWIAIHDRHKGCFMRLAGDNASTFKADDWHVVFDEATKGQGGGQHHALENHHHLHEGQGHNITVSWGKYTDASYENKNTGDPKGCRADIETRPKNITIELYVFQGHKD